MKPVQQTIAGPPDGNCFAACVASILEYEIAALPNPHGERWWEEWLGWLEPLGLTMMNFPHAEDGWVFPGFWIADCDSPRGDFGHAVVMRGAEVVWDPYPQPAPLGAIREVTLLVHLDPVKGRR